MATLAEVNVRIGADISRFQKGLKDAEKSMTRLAGQFNKIGNNLSLGVTLPLAGAAAAAATIAAGFETSTTQIENLVGVQGAELDELKRKFAELGPVVGKTQKELADAALFITGAGLRGSDALDALEASAKASAVGLGDQVAIAKVAGAAVAAYADSNLTAGEAIDKLLGIVREGNAEASELAPVLGSVLPVASQLGVSFDEVGANIAVFTKLGIGASTAADGLRSLLGNLLKPSEQASKELARFGLTAEDVRKSIRENGLAQSLQDLIAVFDGDLEGLSRVFGDVQGFTNVLATAGAQGEVYNATLESIRKSSGSVEQAFQKTSNTAEFKLKKALAGLNVTATKFGATILPIATDLLDLITPIIEGFADMDKEAQKFVLTTAAAAAAIGPLSKGIGTAVEGYSTLRATVKSVNEIQRTFQSNYKASLEAITATGGAVAPLKAGLNAAALAFKGLGSAAQLGVIGIGLAAVTALVAAVVSLNSELSTTEKITAGVKEVTDSVEKSIVSERTEVERLSTILRDNASSYEQKKKALNDLKAISPEFFGNLDSEKIKTEDLNTALEGYLANLRKVTREKLFKDRIDQLEIERIEKLEELQKAQSQQQLTGPVGPSGPAGEPGARASVAGAAAAANAREATIKGLQADIEELAKLQQEYTDIILGKKTPEGDLGVFFDGIFEGSPFEEGKKKTEEGVTEIVRVLKAKSEEIEPLSIPVTLPPTANLDESLGVILKKVKSKIDTTAPQVAASLELVVNPMNDIGRAFDVIDAKGIIFGETFDVVGEKVKVLKDVMVQLLEEGADPLGNSVQYVNDLITQMSEGIVKIDDDMQKLSESIGNVIESGLENFLIAGADALGQFFAEGMSGKELMMAAVEPLLTVMTEVGKLAIQAGIAIDAIQKSLATLNPFVAIAAGVALIGLAAFIRTRLRQNASPRAFAEGGIVTGPTVGLVGEAGPEVIFPLSDLKRFIGNNQGTVNVVGTLYGDDIRLSNERAARRQTRRVGYNPFQ